MHCCLHFYKVHAFAIVFYSLHCTSGCLLFIRRVKSFQFTIPKTDMNHVACREEVCY